MSQAFSHQVHFSTADQTRQFAVTLSDHLKPGDVVLLQGEIGAGKTHLARSLIQARLAKVGIEEDVPSPTFTLVQTYNVGTAEIWHADLYRLTHPDEIEELGLTQAFDDAICLIEWPDRLGELQPDNALLISIESTPDSDQEDHRVITFSGDADIWRDRVLDALPA
ncbi:tRNA (adenosine(37)-N6)-threonylcarbamoyltransferase complex ATPase subunit type 1 TsaE [Aliiroseovarius sp. M344]|uniref:tRNA (adenosine(37)-N6)-threonylcarbamoyltransferase complex ATPase subunit type 1 TsaE n=1 Tax=Aliiroseovarius sp. M344 TaxID=2867010 RepID=UPI0021ADCCCC|nr:tRNA (adenosine(37)-N6)-threonylcarbamoyltransferase complex ATPase subunit type 1 TsaE [Aliiroseovarius sp. M344]UWQ14343.1 tRNA (adenosine(37)-N6)-threonylcarbamoyltransferase complex ATPase subunit type 1 TsaE [Aliiroseovarius sp. M344]